MASVTKYAKTISQTSGGKYVIFGNLNNIKNNTTNSHAVSNVLIRSKSSSPNRPSTINLSNFDFNLPVGAEPTKVVVTYRHQKVAGSDYSNNNKTHICNIGGPTISLTGVKGFSSKGVGCTTTMTTRTKTFSVTNKLTRAQVNSSKFGVKVNYPTNSNKYNGYMRISFIRITVEYKLSSYSVSVKKVNGGYNGDDYTIQLNISNKNKTNYNPELTLTSPLGFSFKSARGTGSISQVNARTFKWNPKLSNKVGTSSINLVFRTNVTYPSGSTSYGGIFELSESLNSTIGKHTATITEKPAPVIPNETVEEPIQIIENHETLITTPHLVANINEDFIFSVEFTDEENRIYNNLTPGEHIVLTLFQLINGQWIGKRHWGPHFTYDESIPDEVVLEQGEKWFIEESINIDALGSYRIQLIYENENNHTLDKDLRTFFVYVRPNEEDLDNPYMSFLRLTEEETNRLGHGYTYIAQTFMKEITEETYVRDWYKNFRLAIFNNPISKNITVTTVTNEETGEVTETITDSTDYEDLSVEEIFDNAEYWSKVISNVNSFENLECEFVYNKNYPIYILFVGDWSDANNFVSEGWSCADIEFTEPCIIEKKVYQERKNHGVYPTPIINLISNDGSTSELTIPTLNNSDPVILYDYPLDEGYGNTDTMSIRGLEIVGTIEQSDELVLSAKLTNTDGIIGQRTVILNDQDSVVDSETEFKLGGLGDLWGFQQKEIHHLEDWELELIVSNTLKDDIGEINFGNVKLIIHTENIQEQDINIKVNDEDLSFYGAFIEDVKIPEGLKTDTDFLTIDGTDTNDAYRQNIREKPIELELSITGCDIKTSTDMLRQLTKVLVNEKDEYNRPIPNRLELSHYPDVYFEYIMEDPLEVTNINGEYNIKAEFTIPSGTAYSKQPTITSIIGFVQGIARINPIICLKPQGSTIEIKEEFTQQKFSMGYSGGWQSKLVELDCENRRAYLKNNEDDTNPIDISKYVDFNSDWFSLHGEYSFSGINCVIRTIEFSERW